MVVANDSLDNDGFENEKKYGSKINVFLLMCTLVMGQFMFTDLHLIVMKFLFPKSIDIKLNSKVFFKKIEGITYVSIAIKL